jgi:dTDP-4-amino-4,6-dideoxygalactose transaminase
MSVETSCVERTLERQFGVERAVCVGRAALGLVAVLRSWSRSRPGTMVALPAAVCHDVLLAILEAECTPVFCDVGVETGLVPASEWQRARALGATVAIVVHLYGNPADVSDARMAFPRPDCLVIDDAAQALGSRTPTGLAGSQGDVGLLSFRATKQISTGGAAVLFHEAAFGAEVAGALHDRAADRAAAADTALADDFRRRLELARVELRRSGRAAAHRFFGLLDGQGRTLEAEFPAHAASALEEQLGQYPLMVERRLAKLDVWLSALEGHVLRPVGMRQGTVPWRFVCRLPGITWAEQHDLGNALRSHAMNVSHWYLPAHWMYAADPEPLPGVETLSREVFQFWIDESTTMDEVARQARIATRLILSHD